mmetsp:Transcript_4314/g.6859  ORF Transcript_4314/g.6859 Transcript_4314/m.6859 type:complete len:151 (-) Transcript_4314:864-1316(-)
MILAPAHGFIRNSFFEGFRRSPGVKTEPAAVPLICTESGGLRRLRGTSSILETEGASELLRVEGTGDWKLILGLRLCAESGWEDWEIGVWVPEGAEKFSVVGPLASDPGGENRNGVVPLAPDISGVLSPPCSEGADHWVGLMARDRTGDC